MQSPGEGKPRLLVVLPGNPGDAGFYRSFLDSLQARGHEATVASHPCLTRSPADLLIYARHHAEAARQHLTATGRSVDDVEVVLLGHSVGAYLAYLLVAHGLLPVARVIMLFPFLMRPALGGRLVLRALSMPWLVRLTLGLLRFLPRALRHRLIAGAGAADLSPLVLSLLESPQVLGCVNMAAREREEIASRRDLGYLFECPLFRDAHRFSAVLAERDVWAPASVASRLPGARHLASPVSHAFVVDARQRELVAETVQAILSRDA